MNVAFVVLVGAIVWGVLSRYVTRNPATWVEEVSSIAFTSWSSSAPRKCSGAASTSASISSRRCFRHGSRVRSSVGDQALFVALYCFYVAWLGLQETIASNSADDQHAQHSAERSLRRV